VTTLLIDCDGVLLDFEAPGMLVAEKLTGVSVTPEQRIAAGWDLIDSCPEWQAAREPILAAWEAEGFCSSLEPIPGAAQFLRDLRSPRGGTAAEMLRRTVTEIFAVTTHMHRSKTWVWEREQSLDKHFGSLLDGYIHTRHKQNVAGDFFIDDKVANVRKWKDKHPTKHGIVFDYHGYSQADHIEDIWNKPGGRPNSERTFYAASYPAAVRLLSLLRI